MVEELNKETAEDRRYSSPFRIRYTFRQCTWLLSNLKDLREGLYPPNPKITNYTDPLIFNKSNEYKAFTENVGTIIGRLEKWLLEMGIAGGAAYYRWGLDLSYSEIAKLQGVSKDEAIASAVRAITYCRDMGRRSLKR